MIDGSDVSIDYELEGTLLDTKLKISNVKVTAQGETVEFPIEIALDYEIGKSKVETSIGVKLEYEGLKLDAVISFKEETTDVNIQIPTNAVTVKELDMDEVQGWLTDAQKKYPKIFDFITDTIGSMSSGPSYDNNYDDDSYYEDDFYFDVEDDYDFYYGGLASGF